jgi:hypothetical protein
MLTRFMFHLHLHRLMQQAGVAVGGLCLASCFSYPDSSERLNDDIVFTGHANESDFSKFKTFAVDPVVHVATLNADNSVDTTDADGKVSDEVIAHVVDLMEKRGFMQVNATEFPDLGVTVTAISGTQVGAVTGGYWGGYYASYWGFPGYAYYYPYNQYYTYQTGSIVVDMADLASGRDLLMKQSSEPDDVGPGGLAVVWAMIGYKAYVEDDVSAKVNSANDAITQAFDQSPYLKRD